MASQQGRTRERAYRTGAPAQRVGRGLACASGALLLASLSIGALVTPCRAADEPGIDSVLVLGYANGGAYFSGPQGIALDVEHGEVVVANTNLHRVEFFDLKTFPRGYFVHRVPGPAGSDTHDGLPAFLAVDREGNVLVSDLLASYVDVVDYRGRTVARLRLPAPDDTIAGGHGPGVLAVGADGDIWVAARGKEGRIYQFDADYRFKGAWGTSGADPGQLSAISSMALTPAGDVVVGCARTQLAIQIFDSRGGYIRGFGVHDIGPGNFSFPSGIAVTGDGRLWVSDAIRHSIQVFDSAGSLLGAVGGFGVGLGEFINPSALASDGKGLLALAENAGSRFQLMWVR